LQGRFCAPFFLCADPVLTFTLTSYDNGGH
jgi:hypothetical protein